METDPVGVLKLTSLQIPALYLVSEALRWPRSSSPRQSLWYGHLEKCGEQDSHTLKDKAGAIYQSM